MKRAPLVVLAIGNPSRGDDALGPRFLEAIVRTHALAIARGELEILADFQLQIEHALDLEGRTRAIVVDAFAGAEPPFRFERALAGPADAISTHALSPAAVLAAAARAGIVTPPTWVLAIGGARFELGEPLSSVGERNLALTLRFFADHVVSDISPRWGSEPSPAAPQSR